MRLLAADPEKRVMLTLTSQVVPGGRISSREI